MNGDIDISILNAKASDPTHRADFKFELRRKCAHLLPGLIPFAMWFVYHEDPLPTWNLAVATAVIAGLTLFAIAQRRRLSRGSEENWLRTCLTYAIPPLAMLILFPARAEYASMVVCVLAFGDSAAAMGGRLYGRRPLPWNPHKTWMGFFCFLLFAVPLGSLVYWGEAHPAVSWESAAFCGTVAAIPAGIAESVRSRIDDNLRIGITAAVGVVVASNLV